MNIIYEYILCSMHNITFFMQQIFISDLIACSTCFMHLYAHLQELKSGCCTWYVLL